MYKCWAVYKYIQKYLADHVSDPLAFYALLDYTGFKSVTRSKEHFAKSAQSMRCPRSLVKNSPTGDQKWAEMGVHKSGFFLKACSLNCLKMQSLRVFRSYMRWKKLGPDYPLKEFHDGKIRILARSDPRWRKIALPPLGNQKGFKSVKENSI